MSGTDGDESPTCLLASFGAEYWDKMGGRNLTFVNNTCLTFSGDVYSYQLDQAAGRQQLAEEERQRRRRRTRFTVVGAKEEEDAASADGGDGPPVSPPAVLPPFYHPKCVPAKMADMYWLSSSNALLTANASRASINCAAKSWSLAEWQATGRDQGSWTGPLPSVEALEQQARELLAGAG
jgi:hypothetical protein